jgi:hypothetical protein
MDILLALRATELAYVQAAGATERKSPVRGREVIPTSSTTQQTARIAGHLAVDTILKERQRGRTEAPGRRRNRRIAEAASTSINGAGCS